MAKTPLSAREKQMIDNMRGTIHGKYIFEYILPFFIIFLVACPVFMIGFMAYILCQ